jgi:hypothetical protein
MNLRLKPKRTICAAVIALTAAALVFVSLVSVLRERAYRNVCLRNALLLVGIASVEYMRDIGTAPSGVADLFRSGYLQSPDGQSVVYKDRVRLPEGRYDDVVSVNICFPDMVNTSTGEKPSPGDGSQDRILVSLAGLPPEDQRYVNAIIFEEWQATVEARPERPRQQAQDAGSTASEPGP